MSFNSSNYMEGVPVKISEKYKPPPKVTIPQAVLNRLNNITEVPYESPQYAYSFQLEKQVIQKLAVWRKFRETERENRRERIRKYEQQKCRDIEEKQKQLLTAVSYPSAEDLSSSDEDGNAVDENKGYVQQKVAPPSTTIADKSNHHPRQNFDTILQPILVANSYNSYSTLSPTVFNPSKINYSDFENDTSSPFDNIELKTINDLDILAQVLNDTQRHSIKNGDSVAPTEEKKLEADISDSEMVPELEPPQSNVNSPPGFPGAEPTSDEQIKATSSSNQNHTANFYYATNVTPSNYQMMLQQTHTLHLQQQQGPQQQHQQQQYMLNYANMNHHHVEPSTADAYFNYNCLPMGTNHNYFHMDYPQQPEVAAVASMSNNAKYAYSNGTFTNNYCHSHYGMNSVEVVAAGDRLGAEITPKSKSKSVPDILKELKDEIRDSEIRRTRNHSQTIDDQTKRNSTDSAQSLSSPAPTSTSSSSSSTSFMKLSPSSQTLAKNISSMGFPLERVAKIAELYGNDDKKIVEHLIPLSELLDLGFDESKISEALVKFDNNKDKALDFLIS